jgi:hypothetical protein
MQPVGLRDFMKPPRVSRDIPVQVSVGSEDQSDEIVDVNGNENGNGNDPETRAYKYVYERVFDDTREFHSIPESDWAVWWTSVVSPWKFQFGKLVYTFFFHMLHPFSLPWIYFREGPIFARNIEFVRTWNWRHWNIWEFMSLYMVVISPLQIITGLIVYTFLDEDQRARYALIFCNSVKCLLIISVSVRKLVNMCVHVSFSFLYSHTVSPRPRFCSRARGTRSIDLHSQSSTPFSQMRCVETCP